MPLFPDLNLIFIHIPKNAGRSIEQALLRNSGSPDGGRRTLLNRSLHGLCEMTASKFAKDRLIGTLDVVIAAQHLTYMEMDLLGLLSPKNKVECVTFAICRNPFDRIVSSINHFYPDDARHNKIDGRDSFERHLNEWLERDVSDHNERAHRRQQIDFVLNCRGRSAVDELLRYECITDDFAALMSKMGAPEIILPWRGKSSRQRSYQHYYTDSAKKLVEQEFGEDLEYFKYKF